MYGDGKQAELIMPLPFLKNIATRVKTKKKFVYLFQSIKNRKNIRYVYVPGFGLSVFVFVFLFKLVERCWLVLLTSNNNTTIN